MCVRVCLCVCVCEQGIHACGELGSQGPLLLPGWGVEAVLKNTEYSAMDEKDRKKEQEAKKKQQGGAAKSDKV
jgi:UDP-glucose:glycoprotein glucosyltransferase